MKRILFILMALVAVMAQAVQPYSPSARLLMNKKDVTPQRIKGESQSFIPVTLRTGNSDALTAYGIEVGTQVGEYVTAMIPLSMLPRLGDIAEIDYIHAGNFARPLLDEALPGIGHDLIGSTTYTMPYTGKGVIVGIVDIGFQWDHIAFCNPDGTTRILAAWNQNDTTGTPPENYSYGALYDTQEEVFAAPYCDAEIHATHVTSIAAGSELPDFPYKGVAPGASLVLVDALHEGENIFNEGIVDGIKFIFDYADRVGMPCVINLSIGGNFGPHDGTSPFDIMCDSLQGEGKLIVGAMGNAGDEYYHFGYDFDENPAEFRLGLKQYGGSLPLLDIWSETPINIGLELYHGHTDTILDWTGYLPIDSLYENTLQYFDREILVTAATYRYPENNLYNTMIEVSGIRNLGNAYFALKVQGESGKVNMWCNSPATEFNNRKFDDWLIGDMFMTLNEVGGTGKRITSVGSYTSDTSKESYSPYTVDYPLYAVSPFSSRGSAADGRMKPEVAAPGCIITAAFNEKLSLDTEEYYYRRVVDSVMVNDRYYYYGANSGTSMAAPIVTGTYAVWLQAEPTLTPEQAKEVLRITSAQDEYTTDATATGYGKIRPYEGLCYLLEKNNVSAPMHPASIMLYPTIGSGEFGVYNHGDAEVVTIEIYNASGALVAQYETHLQASAMHKIPAAQPGIYFIQLTTCNGSHTYKYVCK